MSQPPTILHLGLGSFHRAHLAFYVHRLNRLIDIGHAPANTPKWRIAAGNVRNDTPELVAALKAQKGQYTLETVTEKGHFEYERIESIEEVVEWDLDISGLRRVGSDANTQIISFTVTEAGYFLGKGEEDGKERLMKDHPDVVHDLKSGNDPRTIYKALAMILVDRLAKHGGKDSCPAISLLSCDNLRSNGSRFSAGFTEFLQLLGNSELSDYVASKTLSPNTMVDRITPRPDIPAIQARLGALPEDIQALCTVLNDKAPVMAEQFNEFVLQSQPAWPTPRPAFEHLVPQLKITFTDSVLPYEDIKIRTLNATHTLIAWCGGLTDSHYIHDALAVSQIAQWCHEYITSDVISVLQPTAPKGWWTLEEYRDKTLARFTNAHLLDTNARVAMDGFSKIPGQIAPTVRDRLAMAGGKGVTDPDELSKWIQGTVRITAAFLLFLKKLVNGKLAFPYVDQACDMEVVKSYFANDSDGVDEFAKDSVLWTVAGEHGAESASLAGHPALVKALRTTYDEIVEFVKASGKNV